MEPLTMAKVEASLPFFAKEGCKEIKNYEIISKPTTQPCPNDKWGNEIKNLLK